MPLFALAFMVACSGPAGEQASTGDAVEETESQGEVLAVSTGQVNWVGSAVGKEHFGTLEVSEGNLVVEGENLIGGSFTLDINSITVEDLDEANGKLDLEGHLKSGDFFVAEEFPTARFTITNVMVAEDREDATHMINGNLTIKDITKSVTFPAVISMEGGELMAKTPRFVINRTDWGVNYNSGVIGTAKDKLINDNIALAIELKASKPMM